MRLSSLMLAALAAGAPVASAAAPAARFADVAYEAAAAAPVPPGMFRNPVVRGFNPDPSIVRVGDDFYLVTSTFGWWPGLPVYHSRNLVDWTLIGHALDRPGMVDLSNMGIAADGIYAPAITHHQGKFWLFGTCVRCGGNFHVTATDPRGPWSDPVWHDFEGIDPELFVDDDGRGWVLNNGAPVGPPRYEGHRAIWIQQFDLASQRLVGPRKVLVDGGVNPAEKPIWAEGPRVFKRGGWYYLMPAEGGTADQHSQTIYRSRAVDGPYVPGPNNPILTQRDQPAGRRDPVEATGHADVVELDDGTWWGTFLATRPFAGQSTLLGRETWLLPMRWGDDGWPTFLERGEAVPWTVRLPLPRVARTPQSASWRDSFDGGRLAPEWMLMRGPANVQWHMLDRARGELVLLPQADQAAGKGRPAFLGRRLTDPAARITTRVAFEPEAEGDFAGLLAITDEAHSLSFGIERQGGRKVLALRKRNGGDAPAAGEVLFAQPLAAQGPVDLRLAIDGGMARVSWRPAGRGPWQAHGEAFDVEYMATIHAGLFTGLVVGPYAVAGGS